MDFPVVCGNVCMTVLCVGTGFLCDVGLPFVIRGEGGGWGEVRPPYEDFRFSARMITYGLNLHDVHGINVALITGGGFLVPCRSVPRGRVMDFPVPFRSVPCCFVYLSP